MALGDINLERIAKLPVSQKLLILGGIVTVIFLVYFFTLDRSYKAEINRLRGQISKLDEDITKTRAIANDIDKFRRENMMLQKRLEKALAKLPNKAEVDQILKQVSRLGKENGLEITVFDRKDEKPQSLYIEVPINLNFRGNFFHVIRFLDQIAKMPRITNIGSISLKRQTGGEALDISCILTTYRFREVVEAPPEAEKGAAKKPAGKPKTGAGEPPAKK